MEHTKKMIIVPADSIHRMHQNESIQANTISKLDTEMRAVLDGMGDDSSKWTRYNEILSRYLHHVRTMREPVVMSSEDYDITTDMIRAKPENNTENALSIEEIADVLPKSLKRKGALLLQQIKNSNNIKWDGLGAVTINDVKLSQSNIIDLVSDVVRQRKNSNPRGWRQFAEGLKQLNVAKEFIGNPLRERVIFDEHTPRHKQLQLEEDGYAGDSEDHKTRRKQLKWTSLPGFSRNK